MCICVNCYYVDRCMTYHAVETQHQERHVSENPTFDPVEPSINVNIRTTEDSIEMEWDVVGCESFKQETGKWSKLRPGEPIPT
ncbi:MAG: Ycf34 family protein [Arthrospira sp. SH-MAG29]|nr:Ycf34 family protein [Arthrospira sp. SH-MAG29]MBS0018039.1 Ycf34 family protein [Arthrospira sp. SH-MAG29]